MKKIWWVLTLTGVAALVGLLGYGVIISDSSRMGSLNSAHEHASFKVFINGEEIDFSQRKYMVRDRFVHIENMDGNTIHKHATGVTLGHFFKTLGMKFENNCWQGDDGMGYCNQGEKTLKFYINSQRSDEFGRREIKDGDRYLISFGEESEEDIKSQLAQVKPPLSDQMQQPYEMPKLFKPSAE